MISSVKLNEENLLEMQTDASGKMHYGNDMIEYHEAMNFFDVSQFFMKNGYSRPKPFGKEKYKVVPVNGAHNVVVVDDALKTVTFHYSAPEGRTEAQGVVSSFGKTVENKVGSNN